MADFADILEAQREANSTLDSILVGQVDLQNVMQQQLDTMKDVFSNITTSLSLQPIQPAPPEPPTPNKPDKEAPSSTEEGDKETKSLFKRIGKGLSGISSKLGGILEQGKNAASKVGSGLGAIVKGTLFGALFFGLAKFLQSETFATLLDKLLTVILPKINNFLADLGAFIADPSFGNIGKLIGENKAVLATLSVIILGIGKTIKLITLPFRLIFKTFKAIGRSIEFIKKVDSKSIGKNLKAVGKFLKTFGRLFTRIVPIGALVVSLFSGIMNAISVFKETGSFLEATKEGIASTIANFIGFPLNFLKSVVGFVAGLFGFDDFKEQLAEFDFIKIIKDGIHKVFDFFEDIFGKIKEMIDKAIEFVKNLNPVEVVKNVGKGAMNIASGIKNRLLGKGDEEEPALTGGSVTLEQRQQGVKLAGIDLTPSESTVPATPQGTGGATNVVTTDNSTLNNVVNNSTNSTIVPTTITDTNSSIMTNRME
jgi:hypothetical protein